MAIAGIVLTTAAGQEGRGLAALRHWPGIYEVQHAGEGKLAAVLERPSQDLQLALEDLAGIDAVLQLDVAYVDYEDDLDANGHMRCPSPQPGKQHRAE